MVLVSGRNDKGGKEQFRIWGDNLPVVDEFIYLGCRLIKGGKWSEHVELVENKGERNGSK